jgi:hypothetical protein
MMEKASSVVSVYINVGRRNDECQYWKLTPNSKFIRHPRLPEFLKESSLANEPHNRLRQISGPRQTCIYSAWKDADGAQSAPAPFAVDGAIPTPTGSMHTSASS